METCFKVLQLKFDRKLSNRTIGLTLNISSSTVFEVLARFKASSTPWPLPEALTPEAIESLIFPEKKAAVLAPVLPDWLHIDTEMRRPGVTRQLLWTEYRAQAGKRALGYSQFCRRYRSWKKNLRRSMRQEHRAGEKLFIDFCGPTVPVVNPDTGYWRGAPRSYLRGRHGRVKLHLCWAAFGKRTIMYGCVIAVGGTPTLYGAWQIFRDMR